MATQEVTPSPAAVHALQDLRRIEAIRTLWRIESMLSVCVAALPQDRPAGEPGFRDALEAIQEMAGDAAEALGDGGPLPTPKEAQQLAKRLQS